jgi:1,2-diacylglycerol 3-alpha-glucosyltransferase
MVAVAVIFTNYGSYHLSRLRAFQEICHRLQWELIGIEFARSEAIYPWKADLDSFNGRFISLVSNRIREDVPVSLIIQKLISTLSQLNPDVLVVAGYGEPPMLVATLWGLGMRKPTILLSATKEDDTTRSWWSEIPKRLLIKAYKAALVGGMPQKRYLIKLGMSSHAIFTGYNVVGNQDFHPDKIRGFANPHPKPYFLTINRFVPKKNLIRLVGSYAAYREMAGDRAWDLILCGDGELRSAIEPKIIELNLQNCVHLPGFLQQNELLPYFAHASCFVHASIQEQWGLVVNEAMAAGLPVLVSNRCGCFEDLVIEGVNGFGFDPDNSPQITNLMLKISSEEVNLKQMGLAALEHIQQFSPEYFANSLMQAVKYALAH